MSATALDLVDFSTALVDLSADEGKHLPLTFPSRRPGIDENLARGDFRPTQSGVLYVH